MGDHRHYASGRKSLVDMARDTRAQLRHHDSSDWDTTLMMTHVEHLHSLYLIRATIMKSKVLRVHIKTPV